MTVSTPPAAPGKVMAALRWTAKNWVLVTVGLIAAMVGVLMVVRPGPPSNPTEPGLEQVWNACGRHGQLSDGGKTLVLDMQGRDDVSGVRTEEVGCTLDYLKTPTYVREKMASTRAVDGRQDEAWDNGGLTFEASWTYHPDNGLDILIREL
jgi:hypothetical protein